MNYSMYGDIFDVMIGPTLATLPDPSTLSFLLLMRSLEWWYAPKVRKPRIYHVAENEDGFYSLS